MPFLAAALPALTSIGSAAASAAIPAALGAFGSSGKQGGQIQSGTSSESFNQAQKFEEPEYFSQLRQDIIPIFMGLMKEAIKPVYGKAQIAEQVNKSNDLSASSVKSFLNSLAGAGRLRSGAADLGLAEIEKSRLGQIGGFLNNLPFMESQAKMERMIPLLGLGANWTGRAPVNSTVTGSGTKVTNGVVEQQGPSWGRSFISGLGGALGRQGSGSTFGGGKNNPYPTYPGGGAGDWYNLPVDPSVWP